MQTVVQVESDQLRPRLDQEKLLPEQSRRGADHKPFFGPLDLQRSRLRGGSTIRLLRVQGPDVRRGYALGDDPIALVSSATYLRGLPVRQVQLLDPRHHRRPGKVLPY